MMSAARWRALVVCALMMASAAAAMLARPTRQVADIVGMPNLETMLPKQFGTWRIDTTMPIILPAPDVQAQLDKIYNQVLARTYVDAQGQRIMLSVAYGGDQSDATSAHRPEVCYPAQGFAITSNSATTLSIAGRVIPVRQLMAVMGERYEPITYWVVVGDEAVTTGIGQKIAQMRYGLRGLVADGMLVRVSSIDRNMQAGLDLQKRFLKALGASLDPVAARRVFGAEGAR